MAEKLHITGKERQLCVTEFWSLLKGSPLPKKFRMSPSAGEVMLFHYPEAWDERSAARFREVGGAL
jgi:hypothetical protein